MSVHPHEPKQGYQGYPAPNGQASAPPGQAPPPVQYAQPGQQPPAGYQQPNAGVQPVYHPGMAAAYGGYPGVPMQPPPPAEPMPRPQGVAGCPPGLEYLTQIDQVLVHQQIDLVEMMTNIQMENKYEVKNTQGQLVYFATEESDGFHRQCCGANRGFTLHINDNAGNEVIRVVRDFKCGTVCGCNCCACCSGCQRELVIEAPPGTQIGTARQKLSCLPTKFDIIDENGVDVLEVESPTCVCQGPCCTADQDFMVRTPGGPDCGKITKQWSGYLQEMLTNADKFSVSFPMDLDVKIKAVMIAQLFLIDFMFFQQPKNKGGHHHRRGRRR